MKYLKLFENKSDFSEFDLDNMINEVLYNPKRITIDILKLLFKCGGKINKKNILSFMVLPGLSVNLKISLCKILIENGANINELIYFNGRFSSVTILTMLCSIKDRFSAELIIEVIKMGGDMSIKDNFEKSAFDYLNDSEVKELKKLSKDFKEQYEFYMTTKNFNL